MLTIDTIGGKTVCASAHLTGDGAWSKSTLGHTFSCKMENVFNQREIILGGLDLLWYTGLSTSQDHPADFERSSVVSGYRPSRDLRTLYGSAQYKWNRFVDTTYKFFRGDWNFARIHQSVPNENPVLHKNLVGHVEAGSSSLFNYRDYLDSEGLPESETGVHLSFIPRLVGSSYEIEPSGWNSTTLEGFLDYSFLETLDDQLSAGMYASDGPNNKNWAYKPSIVASDLYHSVRFLWLVGDRVGAGWRWTLMACCFNITISPTPMSVSIDTEYDLNDVFIMDTDIGFATLFEDVYSFSYSSNPTRMAAYDALGLAAFDGVDPSGHGSFVAKGSPYFSGRYFTRPYKPSKIYELIGYSPSVENFYSTEKGYLAFHNVYGSMFPNFVAGCFLSTQDALDTYLGGLSGNYIETASEIGDFLRPLSLIGRLKDLLPHISGKGLKGLLRFLADADLTYRFGIAPTISDAKDISRKSDGLLTRLTSDALYMPQTIYGKEEFTGLTGLSDVFDPVDVICRSKIRLGYNLDSFLPYVLPLEMLGVLPTLSRVWDLIPYSWLLDYLVDIGGGANLIDATVFQHCFDIDFSVHTVKVHYTFSAEDQADYGFANSSEGEHSPGYLLFVRWALNETLPSLGPTTLPLFRPTRLPSWDLTGSILTKRI